MADGSLNIEDLLGPRPQGAPPSASPAAPQTQTVESLLGPAPGSAPSKPISGPNADSILSSEFNRTGRLLDAFGQGAKQGWGSQPLGLSDESEKYLRDVGVFNDYQNGHTSFLKSMNEAFMRPAATALDLIFRRVPGALVGGAVSEAQQQAVERSRDLGMTEQQAQEQGIAARNLFGAATEYGMTDVPTLGTLAPHAPGEPAALPRERVDPIPPEIARAREFRVIGGTDADYQGLTEPEPPTPEVQADTARRLEDAQKAEEPVPGELQPSEQEEGVRALPPTEQPLSIEAVRRQIAPDTFRQYDALQVQQQTFRRWQQELRDTRDQNIRDQYDPQIAEEQAKLDAGAAGRRAATYRRCIADLSEQRDKALSEAGMTPDMLRVQEAAQQVDYKLRDLAPDVTRATQQAADQLGQPGPTEALGAPAPIAERPPAPPETAPPAEQPTAAPEQAAEAQVAPPQETPAPPQPAAPAPEPVAAQPEARPSVQGTIANDVAAKVKSGGITQEQAEAQGAVVQALYESRAAAFEGRKGTAEDLYRERQPEVVISPKPYLRVPGRKGKIFGEHDDFEEEGKRIITLFGKANASTFMHEMGHDTLTWLMHDADDPLAPEQLKQDAAAVRDWLGVEEGDGIGAKQEERFANGFERYLMEGRAPSQALAGVFAKFKQWLTDIYRTLRPYPNAISDEIRDVFNRLLTTPEGRTVIAPHEDLLGIGERHTEEAATTPPELAATTADRIQAEADAFARQEVPEIADELGSPDTGRPGEGPATTGGETPGGPPNGGGNERQLEPAGAVSREATGTLGEGGGEPAPQVTRARGKPSADEQPTEPFEQYDADRRSDLVDKAGNIRLDNLNTPEEINAILRDTAAFADDHMAWRGPVSDEQVLNIADAMGLKAADIDLKKLAEELGRGVGAADIYRFRRLLVQSANAVRDAWEVAANGTDADVMKYGEVRARHLMIQNHLAAVTAEAGRMLRAFQSMEGLNEAKAIGDFLNENTGRTLFQLRREAQLGRTLKTPSQINGFVRDAAKPSGGEMLLELYRNWLLSGPITHTSYIVGGELFTLYKAVPEAFVKGVVSAIHEKIAGEPIERMYPGEAAEGAFGFLKGQKAGFRAAANAFKSGNTVALPQQILDQLSKDETAKYNAMRSQGATYQQAMAALGYPEPDVFTPYQYRRAIPGAVGAAIRIPTERMIAPIHSHLNALNFEIAKSQLVYRRAMSEGLEGEALAQRIAELNRDTPEDIMREARGEAPEAGLTVQTGKFADLVKKAVGWQTELPLLGRTQPLSFIQPFVGVYANMQRLWLMNRTPLGLASKVIRDDVMGRNGVIAQDTAIAKMALGSAVTATGMGLAAQLFLNPSEPDDYKAAAMSKMANGQPHSLRLGNYSLDFSKLGVLGEALGYAADIYQALHVWQQKDAGEAFQYFSHAVALSALREGMLSGFASAINAVENANERAYFLRNFASSFAVPTGLSQLSRIVDPNARQARTILDAIKNRVPWVSEQLSPQVDIWGQPILNRDFWGVYVTRRRTDPTSQEMERLGEATGKWIAPASRTIGKVHLTDQEWADFATMRGQALKLALDRAVAQPSWQRLPDRVKDEMIFGIEGRSRSGILNQVTEAARQSLMAKYPHIITDNNAAKEMARNGVKP